MSDLGLACIRCGTEYPIEFHSRQCPNCGPLAPSALTVTYARDRLDGASRDRISSGPRSLWRYDHSLPVAASDAISIGEGVTPLVELIGVGREINLPRLYGKCEFANPTGSFKDRLASSAVTAAKRIFNAHVIATSSTGNAGASAAAYAARAGLQCVVLTAGANSSPMISQMLAYGATVISLPAKPDRWAMLSAGVEHFGWFPTSPFFGPPIGSNPFGIEGYKSLAYEICEDMEWKAPDWIVLPVCYGDALYGIWKGFKEILALGWSDRMPRFAAAEIYGSLTEAFNKGREFPPEMPQPYTTSASSITSPQGTLQSIEVLRQTSGLPVRILEEELSDFKRLVAERDGIYLETAAAAAVAGAGKLKQSGDIKIGDRVVCLLTAGGLKEARTTPDSDNKVITVDADIELLLGAVRTAKGIDLRA